MEINDAYDYLIHLIACAIHDEVPKPMPDGITYGHVLSCAIRHDVAGFAYLGVIKAGHSQDVETLEKWNQRYLLGIQRNAEQEEIRRELVDALHSDGIATLELQGTKVKQYYPSSDLRLMGDIDIIIRKEDIPAAENVLRKLGYSISNQYAYEIDAYSGDKTIEIHSDFFVEGTLFEKIMSDPFKGAVIHEDLNVTVTDTVFWSFHLLHCLKHYRTSGIGLRRVLDLYFLKDVMEMTADKEFVNALLSKYGLTEDINDLFAVADYFFDGKVTDRDISDAVVAIKSAGSQGNLSVMLENKFKGKRFVKFRYLLSLVFISKENIYKSYPYCKKHNYPYYLAWLHRAIRIPFKPGRMKLLIKYLRNTRKVELNRK